MDDIARTPVIAPLVRFWRSDKGLSVFSVLLLALVFVLPPLLPSSTGDSLAGNALFALVLLSGVLALSEHGLAWRLLMAAAVVSVAIIFATSMLAVPEPVIQVAELVSVVLLLVVVLDQTFRAGPVTRHRIQGGIAAYLLLGLAWAKSYVLLETLQPGSFSGAVDLAGWHRGLVYFSFVTLTTVGYGDILPVRPAARSLAMLEAVVGPLYIAILLARLVSLAMAPGTGAGPRKESGDGA
jgi:ion channel